MSKLTISFSGERITLCMKLSRHTPTTQKRQKRIFFGCYATDLMVLYGVQKVVNTEAKIRSKK